LSARQRANYRGPQTQKADLAIDLLKSGRPDLNRGPLRPERSALPD
jgi:hypothetical protein